MTQQAGWYPDPGGGGERWHDGRRWTGVTRTDPLTARVMERREGRLRRRRRLRVALAGILLLGAVTAGAGYVEHHSHSLRAVAAGLGLTHHRLLPRVSPATTSLNYTILRTDRTGQPVTYNPCQPIKYMINPAGAPSDYMSFVAPAIAAAQQASGLKFVYEGTTTATFDSRQRAMSPEPVVIAFPATLHSAEATPDAVGLGGSTALTVNGVVQPHYVTGAVALLSSWFNQQSALHHRAAEQAVVMHELGHVLGLGHVQDPSQIMYPAYHGQAAYGQGDLAGLAAEGNGAC